MFVKNVRAFLQQVKVEENIAILTHFQVTSNNRKLLIK
jgi:hypothetical protein